MKLSYNKLKHTIKILNSDLNLKIAFLPIKYKENSNFLSPMKLALHRLWLTHWTYFIKDSISESLRYSSINESITFLIGKHRLIEQNEIQKLIQGSKTSKNKLQTN